jgi:hypothetical protein
MWKGLIGKAVLKFSVGLDIILIKVEAPGLE